MRIQKRKVNKKTVSNSMEINNITGERFVELQAEAYYKAIKRIEDEKNDVLATTEERKRSILQNLTLAGYIIFRPKKMVDKYGLKDGVTNGIFAVISSIIMSLIGHILRFSSALIIIVVVLSIFLGNFTIWVIHTVLISIVVAMIGSLFLLSGQEIKREKDSAKVTNYTTNVFAMLGVVIAIVAIFLS